MAARGQGRWNARRTNPELDAGPVRHTPMAAKLAFLILGCALICGQPLRALASDGVSYRS